MIALILISPLQEHRFSRSICESFAYQLLTELPQLFRSSRQLRSLAERLSNLAVGHICAIMILPELAVKCGDECRRRALFETLVLHSRGHLAQVLHFLLGKCGGERRAPDYSGMHSERDETARTELGGKVFGEVDVSLDNMSNRRKSDDVCDLK